MIKKAILLISFLLIALTAFAGTYDLILQWDENTEPDLATGDKPRYKIYISTDGKMDGDKTKAEQIVDQLQADDESEDPDIVHRTLPDLDDTIEYSMAVTALDEWGNESELSNEVQTDIIPPGPPTGCTFYKINININIGNTN